MPMTTKNDPNYLAWAWVWVLGVTLFRLIYVNFFPLAPDEANYWQWSRYLDWSYHDQSPLIAWAIWPCTYFLGNTEWAVRLPSVIAMAVTALYLVSMAARWVDHRAADLKKARPRDDQAIEGAEGNVKELTRESRDLAAKAKEIEDAVYDLKAVNPHKKPNVDTRTPEELMNIIEAKGKEVADALAVLRGPRTKYNV